MDLIPLVLSFSLSHRRTHYIWRSTKRMRNSLISYTPIGMLMDSHLALRQPTFIRMAVPAINRDACNFNSRLMKVNSVALGWGLCVTEWFQITDFCSHRRSVDYWAESVINENNFQAIALSNEVSYNFLSWGRFKANADLDYDNVVPMGIACPVTAEGDYYLQTNGTSPFGRSEDGITFDSTIWKGHTRVDDD